MSDVSKFAFSHRIAVCFFLVPLLSSCNTAQESGLSVPGALDFGPPAAEISGRYLAGCSLPLDTPIEVLRLSQHDLVRTPRICDKENFCATFSISNLNFDQCMQIGFTRGDALQIEDHIVDSADLPEFLKELDTPAASIMSDDGEIIFFEIDESFQVL